MKNFVAAALCSAATLALAFPAAAQSIDYGALEQLFGEPTTVAPCSIRCAARSAPTR